MTSNTPEPQALEPVEVTQEDEAAATTAWNSIADEFNQWSNLSEAEQNHWISSFARHRQSSNAAGVGVSFDDGLAQRFRSALRFAASRSVISAEDERAILASLSTPTAEPMAELQRLGQEYDTVPSLPRAIAAHVETLNWLSSQYLPGGPRDVKGAIRAAVNALTPKVLCEHGHTDPMQLCNDCEANSTSLTTPPTPHEFVKNPLIPFPSCQVCMGPEDAEAHSPPTPDRIGKDAVREALREAAETLSWAARRMKGSCRGSDIDAVNLAAGNAIRALSATPAQPVDETERLPALNPIETMPLWATGVVTDGERAAVSQKAESDFGGHYFAVEPEDGLEWEPTHWAPFPVRAALQHKGEVSRG